MVETRKRYRRIRQGDVLRDIPYIEHAAENRGIIEVSRVQFPLVIVLTQDCDLEQDYQARWGQKKAGNQDKWLLSVLVAPLYNIEHVYKGEHLSKLDDMKMQEIIAGKTQGNYLVSNQLPRYHYIEFPQDVPIVPSVIDFKHYFSVNVRYLQKRRGESFVCSVSPLFREDIVQRFASFLSRIGLPEGK